MQEASYETLRKPIFLWVQQNLPKFSSMFPFIPHCRRRRRRIVLKLINCIILLFDRRAQAYGGFFSLASWAYIRHTYIRYMRAYTSSLNNRVYTLYTYTIIIKIYIYSACGANGAKEEMRACQRLFAREDSLHACVVLMMSLISMMWISMLVCANDESNDLQ